MVNTDSHVKLVKTETIVDSPNKKPKKEFTPVQSELKEAILSLSTWDDFEAELVLFRSKNVRFHLENHASAYNLDGLETKTLRLDEFITKSENTEQTLGEIISKGLKPGQYKFRVYEGQTYLCMTPFALYVNSSQNKEENKKPGFDWQALLGTAVSVALPKLVENLSQPKTDNLMQKMMLDYMRQNDEQRREDRKEFKEFMKNNSSNDDPLHLLDLMQRLDEFKSTLVKPPAPPPIASGNKWEKIAEKLIDNLQAKSITPTAAPMPDSLSQPTNSPNKNLEVIEDLRKRIYHEIENNAEPVIVLMSLRDLYLVGLEAGLDNVPEHQQSGGKLEDTFSLFLSKAEDQDYQNKLIAEAQKLLPAIPINEAENNGSAA